MRSNFVYTLFSISLPDLFPIGQGAHSRMDDAKVGYWNSVILTRVEAGHNGVVKLQTCLVLTAERKQVSISGDSHKTLLFH